MKGQVPFPQKGGRGKDIVMTSNLCSPFVVMMNSMMVMVMKKVDGGTKMSNSNCMWDMGDIYLGTEVC